jgi:sulfatase maturation enzyme AslB (radical SAM superfamily)
VVSKLCENFKWVGIGLSIDGTEKQYEYLRHLGNWDVVKNNVAEYVKLFDKYDNLIIQVTCTIGWQNAWYLPEIHQFFYDNAPKFRIWNNIIHHPEHMTLWAIPQEMKEAIREKWLYFNWKPQYRDDIRGILNHMDSKSITDREFQMHVNTLKEVDSIRGENLLESFPAIVPHLQKYF